VYEFAQQRVHAQGAGGARVQGTIRPECRPARPSSGLPGSGATGSAATGSGGP
jgi:hypothetical protein